MVDIPRNKQGAREPGLIPMINVVLLLLVFFLVAGSIEKFDVIKMELPVAKNGKRLTDGQVVVMLGEHREIIVDDDFIQPPDFLATMKERLSGNQHRVISLKADNRLPATFMISIMNQIKEAGGDNISLITTPF
ncbi:MAG TPA: biopolymer transporter ExbD [Rickettsiales bacterium]|nr:biopolymer transporter ExbD [Rickettsiales bacterium]